ncbi:MAG: hypothetical protein QOH06_4223 [Acidobacteriota bacterium]|jgi:predicted acylesterase/phospholipase RssA|nr:hypothetical protein [Acidobacteriota bacterium]
MKVHRAFLLPVLLALCAQPALANHDDCKSALPQVLKLGLTRQPETEQQRKVLEAQVRSLISDIYDEHGRCSDMRPLKVDIALGNDYEILDWLGQDLIDAAIVPELTLYLLKRDEVELRELAMHEHKVQDLVLPDLQARVLSGQLSGRRWSPRADPQRDLEELRKRVLKSALEREDSEHWDAEAYWLGKKDDAKVGLGYRAVLVSHLSSTGFLEPVASTQRWLEERLDRMESQRRASVQDLFWQVFFENARFTLECGSLTREPGARGCWELPRREEEEGNGPIEVLFPGERVLRRPGQDALGVPAGGGSYHDHLVFTPAKAEALFHKEAYAPINPVLPPELEKLFAEPDEHAQGPPRAFLPMLAPEPYFGVRTFGFTVDESMRLLRQDRATSGLTEGELDLALVLPGGGVKAAYQSRIVDELYRGGRYLKNFTLPKREDALSVDYVIGTSGGALLGFFVAQLSEKGPWNLTEILWHNGDDDLKSTDIFGWTDLLRYASIVTGFLILCFFLGVFSIPERAALNPARRPRLTAWRLRLTLAIMPLLLIAPLLVRLLNEKATHEEQVPAIEGLIYAVLGMCAMFADQCLVLDPRPSRRGAPWVKPAVPLIFGGLLVVLPLIAALTDGNDQMGERWFARDLTVGFAFAFLGLTALLGGLVFPLRVRSRRPGLRTSFFLALEVAVPLLLVVGTIGLVGVESMPRIPFFLSGFLLVFVLIAAIRFLGSQRRWLRGAGWWTAYYGSLLLAASLVLSLVWPGELGKNPTFRGALSMPTLDIPVGTLLLCIGLALLLVGGIAWVYASEDRYHLRMPRRFLAAFFVVLAHAVAVSLAMYAVMCALPGWLSPLELTGGYWRWLFLMSVLFGLGLLLFGIYGRRGGRVLRTLRQGLVYLCSHHPNGDFVTRRFLRLAAMAVFVLVWWNMIVAPALYGNGAAQGYLLGAMKRYREAGKKAGVQVASTNPAALAEAAGKPEVFTFEPTSRFIAPANVLEKDGTRYYLFVPEEKDCPPIPRRAASGARWLPYRMKGSGGECLCKEVPSANREYLQNVVFASGSPFPIFPAHRVPDLGQERHEKEAVDKERPSLVDGGYSNNIPVDAARTVSAEQVLIVESTNPLGPPRIAETSRLPKLPGKLVENLGRLPSFLFERSQQVDRLSRQGLFVVSLSPSREWKNWPPLFDFRGETVKRMEDLADVDLKLRTGMVQSWGHPSFVLSVEVKGKPREEQAPHEHAEGETHPHV